MFEKKTSGNKFGYKPVHTDITKKDTPLKERMKISSFSSQEGRKNKKKTIILILFFILIISVIVYFGFPSVPIDNIKIEDVEFEKTAP